MSKIILQFHKPMVIGWGAHIENGEVPTIRMEAKESLQIVIDEQEGTVSLVEGKE